MTFESLQGTKSLAAIQNASCSGQQDNAKRARDLKSQRRSHFPGCCIIRDNPSGFCDPRQGERLSFSTIQQPCSHPIVCDCQSFFGKCDFR